MTDTTVISTFSGPGGSSIGYERAGCDVRVALDSAPNKFSNAIPETYRRNHPDTTFLEQNAWDTTADDLLDAAGLEQGELDILDGSPPCSPFSGANNKVSWGDHKSGTLFDRYVYFIEGLQPKAFVAENVPELAQGKTKGYYKQLCENMRDAGYNLTVQNIDAAYLGAAHHRRRLMFIGVREDIGTPPTIKPTSKPTTVKQAWNDLEQSQDKVKSAKKRCERSTRYKYIIQLPPDAKTSIEEIRNDGLSTGFTTYRLSHRKPSVTLTSKRADIIHPSEDRYITLPEAKRLIGLPDDYDIPNWECVIRCLPPVLTKTIANSLQQVLANH
jgi:DNA (cytosine-5)-methyltransferase 1